MEFTATRVHSFLSSPVNANHAKTQAMFTGRRSTAHTRIFLRHCHHQRLHLTPVCHCTSFFHCAATPGSCLGPLDLSPRSLGFSSSARSGRCSSSARSCAAQGRMSACRTRPAANPGGPQGGAQTGRRWGGGSGRKLSRPCSETKCCGGFPGTPPGPFTAQTERTRRHQTGTRIQNKQ